VIDPSIPYDEQLRRRAEAIATVCVHGGEPTEAPGALDVPIVLSSAFAFASAEQAARAFTGDEEAWIYGRWGNPTVSVLEAKLAALEGAEAACATASGMAAIAGVLLSTCEKGDHVVAPRAMYAESARLLRERLPRLGIETTFVDGAPEDYARAMTPATKILYLETPANPTLAVVDLAAIAALAAQGQSAAAPRPIVVVDGTFATPFAQTPLLFGADLVVHSMTKGIGGHGDVIGGAVAGTTALVARARETVVKGLGGVLSPLSAWLVTRGLRTFALRQERACATAARLAAWLAEHPRVGRVHHPSLPSHPGHALARRQMHAYGAVLSFEISGEEALERGRRALGALRIATHAVSLGDVRTLVVHPASTTHSTMPREARELAGITDGLLRVSVGLESEADLRGDLERALT
jgi:methionine-gamma-lyase